jgi:hypothetical protein
VLLHVLYGANERTDESPSVFGRHSTRGESDDPRLVLRGFGWRRAGGDGRQDEDGGQDKGKERSLHGATSVDVISL